MSSKFIYLKKKKDITKLQTENQKTDFGGFMVLQVSNACVLGSAHPGYQQLQERPKTVHRSFQSWEVNYLSQYHQCRLEIFFT